MEKETKDEKSMFRMSIITRWVVVLILLIIGCIALSFANANVTTPMEKKVLISDTINAKGKIDTIKLIDSPIDNKVESVIPYQLIREQMIAEVDKYIRSITKGKHDERLAEYLVDNSIEHNINLCFMMSQTQIETCFGTTGVGRPTSRRSLFGIITKKWHDYDIAIHDYCVLLKKSYLVRGRTEYDLMKNYVTGSGARYAGSRTYESELRNTFSTICKSTKIDELAKQYKTEYNKYLVSLSKTNSDSLETELS